MGEDTPDPENQSPITKTIGDEVAQELLKPEVQEDKVQNKATELGNGLWNLHTKVIIKKNIIHPDQLNETNTEEMTQKPGYILPTSKQAAKPSGLCDYSSSESESEEESSNSEPPK